ncbi:helix-turn-helix domain-containing protein [Streptomyces sp. NPDC055078]
MRQRSGRTVQHAVLAARLRQLRERAGLSQKEAADALGAHRTTVLRIERAETSLDSGQVRALLRLYGTGAAEVEQFLGQLASANLPGWWHPWRDVMDPWQQDLMSVESASRIIRLWHPALVPELLRTPAYARAVEDVLREDASPADRERRVEYLRERQARLAERTTRIWALMPEAALNTWVAGDAVMREQAEALRATIEHPELITLQIVPLAAPLHPLTGAAALTVYRVDVPEIPDHVVRDSPVGAPDIWDDTCTVTAYRMRLDAACAFAPPPQTPLPATRIRPGETNLS